MVASDNAAMTVPGGAMPKRSGFLQFATPRSRGINTRRLLALARVLGLVSLLLLPMQMRAGADDPHPHALLQLILDARDGVIDHHGHLDDHSGDAEHGSESVATGATADDPDVPTFGESGPAGGGMAMLAAVVILFAVPASGPRRSWPLPARWSGRLPELDPPPPRIGSI